MRTIIAGSRTITDYYIVEKICCAVMKDLNISEIVDVSGTARGVDQLGEQFALNNGFLIDRYPADWDTHGKSAGYIRNQTMAKNADILIALWDGKSKGTKHMIDLAKKHQIIVYVYNSITNKLRKE